ncbi:MAG: peptidyl-prolyl cis-trans isomerase, partial [Candidatus Omnitrophota bacterium]
MIRLVISLALVSSIFCGLSGCGKNNSSDNPDGAAAKINAPAFQLSAKGKIVARVNNLPIGLEDLNQEIEVYNSMVPPGSPELKISTREKKIDYLKNEMVRRNLLYQAALNSKLDKSREFIDALEKAKLDLLIITLVKQEAKNVEVTPKEIENYYNAYKDQLKSPEEINIREIVVSSESEAKDILVDLLKGEDFASLARKRSKSKSAKSNGNLGFVSRDTLSKEMANIAWALPAGQPSGVFKGADGYYI